MWVDIVLGALVIATTVGIATRVVAKRRGSVASSGEGGIERSADGPWSAASVVERAFPIERTPHERNIGDAAFVDGLVVGYYVAPHRDGDRGAAGAEASAPVWESAGTEVPGDPAGDVDDAAADSSAFSWAAPVWDGPATSDDDEVDLDLDAGCSYGGAASPWEGPSGDGPAGDGCDEDLGFNDGFGFDEGSDDDW